ncbi:hypothetical protein [Rhizobium rhizogenes]|uniref:hypothetical protein n=1 Tax=Rhizobium rhizogenes TaxID=359 RepID=UPI0022C27957|nr:hypothetical protein [Rhizobium rhizogenes]MCZ7487942.1 hypothetical protein [Rhizobium rhizogenes]
MNKLNQNVTQKTSLAVLTQNAPQEKTFKTADARKRVGLGISAVPAVPLSPKRDAG